MTFRIITDSTADLPKEWLQAYDVTVLGLTVQLDDVTYETVGEDALTSTFLLEKMVQGGQPTTSQINVGQFEEVFRQAAQNGEAILYLALTAVLSGTYQSAVMAREIVLEEFPEAVIEIIDTKSATIGESYLVKRAGQARAAGQTIEQVVELLEDLIPRLRLYFVVDDLQHLVRGGRLSKTAAMIGGLVNIKPLLTIDAEGRLIPIAKLRGKKKAMKEISRLLEAEMTEEEVVIAYTGDEALAEELKANLLVDTPAKEVTVTPLGPVIAAHTGIGTLAVLILGKTAR